MGSIKSIPSSILQTCSTVTSVSLNQSGFNFSLSCSQCLHSKEINFNHSSYPIYAIFKLAPGPQRVREAHRLAVENSILALILVLAPLVACDLRSSWNIKVLLVKYIKNTIFKMMNSCVRVVWFVYRFNLTESYFLLSWINAVKQK